METSWAATTVTNEEPEMSPDVAVIVVAPRATPVTLPLLAPTLFTVAEAGTDEVQFAVLVMLAVVPSRKWPVAVNGVVTPIGTLAGDGVTSMETSTAASAAGTHGTASIPASPTADAMSSLRSV